MDTVWMVTADTWTSGYGSSVYLVGIFDDEQKADDAVEIAKAQYKIVNKFAVKLNSRYDLTNPYGWFPDYDDDDAFDDNDEPIPPENTIYLGGYIE